MDKKINIFLALCGAIGPIYFLILIITIGFLHPNYNHITQYISELSAVNAPYAIIMNTIGFPLLGLFIIAFSYSLYKGVKYEKGLIIGPILVAISGISFILVAIFPCDPNCITISMKGAIHGHVANISQFSLIFAPLFMYNGFRKDERWHNYHIFSLLIIIIALFFSVLYKMNFFTDMIGLFQRISFGIPLFWVEITAIKLFRIL